MFIESVLLIATRGNAPEIARQEFRGLPLLDWQIHRILKMQRKPILISRPNFEPELQSQRLRQECLFVHDKSPNPNLCSAIRAGFEYSLGFSFALPLDIPAPREETWREMENRFWAGNMGSSIHILRPMLQRDEIKYFGFPLLISEKGRHFMKEFREDTEFPQMNGLSMAEMQLADTQTITAFDAAQSSPPRGTAPDSEQRDFSRS